LKEITTDKVDAQIIYIMVKQFKQRRARPGLMLGDIQKAVNELRVIEKDDRLPLAPPTAWQLRLQGLKDRKWLVVEGKFWKIHPDETEPYIVKEVETARLLKSIVELVENKGKGKEKEKPEISLEPSEIVEFHLKKSEKLKDLKNVIEKKMLPELAKGPYPYAYIEMDRSTGKYHLVNENYYNRFPEGEEYYIDLVLKYQFRAK
jgi:hypothetical protein